MALEVRNDHPSAMVTLHDVEAHVQGTARSGDKASQRFVAPGNNRVGGRLRRRSGSVGVGTGGGSSSAPLEVSESGMWGLIVWYRECVGVGGGAQSIGVRVCLHKPHPTWLLWLGEVMLIE